MKWLTTLTAFVFILSSCFVKSEKGSFYKESFEEGKKVIRKYNNDRSLNRIEKYVNDSILAEILYTRNGDHGIRLRSDSFPVFQEDSCYNCDIDIFYVSDRSNYNSWYYKFSMFTKKSIDGEFINQFKLINSDTLKIQHVFKGNGDTTIIREFNVKFVEIYTPQGKVTKSIFTLIGK